VIAASVFLYVISLLWHRLRGLNSKPQLSVLPYTITILGKGKLLERPELYTVPTGNRGGTPTHALFALFYSTYSAPCRRTLETPQTRRSNTRSRAAQFALSEAVAYSNGFTKAVNDTHPRRVGASCHFCGQQPCRLLKLLCIGVRPPSWS